jgi:glycosyltransferase involved in cell wall biosynthesis
MLVKGGAESLTLTLCESDPDIDLMVGFVDHNCFTAPSLIKGRLAELTTPTNIQGWQSIKMSLAFESGRTKSVRDYEKVIYSGSVAPLAVKHRDSGGNILYCHTPPRFIYDLKEHYLSTIPSWQRPLLRLLIAYLRPKYEASIGKMDLLIANSVNVQRRIKHFLGRDSIVVYPPCHVDKYSWLSQQDFYLSTARIEPYKRVRLIVEAFMQMPDKKLVVASGGSDLASLHELAKDYNNIEFTGWCEEQQLHDLMGNCIATLYLPMDEDFGISPVESMAAGKPVIGVNEGGVQETVIDGLTGLLCPSNPSVADIMASVNTMSAQFALSLRDHCEQRAALFSADIFVDKMKQILDSDLADMIDVAAAVDAS